MKSLPSEFAQLGLDVAAFKYSDSKSFRGPCPACGGGTRRFVIFVDHPWPLNHGYCDLCGYSVKAWQKVHAAYDPQRAAAYEAERAKHEQERAEYRKVKLAEFTTGEIWKELHERMTVEHVDWWEANGVPREVLDDLKIGYTPNKSFVVGTDENGYPIYQHSPAFTIPWFGQGFTFNTMQYRLLADVGRRYIFEDGLGGKFYYMTQPDQPIKDKVIICEGAKKAIVTWFWLTEGFTVLGAPSANTFDAALEATKDCGLRYLVFDPDVKPHWKNKATKNKNTHLVDMPYKIDDGWMKYGLDRGGFMRILDGAL